MTNRGRLRKCLARTSVGLFLFVFLFQFLFNAFPTAVSALNEPYNDTLSGITGLWNTGRSNTAPYNVLNLPARNIGGPAGPISNTNSGNPYPAAGPGVPSYYVNHAETNAVRDPHWRLVGISSPPNGPHCQNPTPRQATTVEAVDYDRSGPDWVWWRSTIQPFLNEQTRWIGASPDAYHEGNPPHFYTPGCNDPSNNITLENSPLWTYELNENFHVGSCVNPDTVILDLTYGVDNDIRIVVNGNWNGSNLVGGTQILPTPPPGPNPPPTWAGGSAVVRQTTSVNINAFQPGRNRMFVQVRSGPLLTGFALTWNEVRFECAKTRPYMRVYGNDVKAGGGLKTSCSVTNNKATILSYAQGSAAGANRENWRGAGVQFAAFALGEITGFMSASQTGPRTNSPPGNTLAKPIIDLTFGNYDPANSLSINSFNNSALYDPNKVEGFGGDSGMASCIDDYYSLLSGNGAANHNSNIMSARTINGAVAEYHNGDLYIDGDIDLAAGPWANPASIPSYYLAVRGNIYVSSAVNNLDGVFIAQEDPSRPNTGRIYTCATGLGSIPDEFQQANQCRRRLTVNGAFIAKQVKFQRSIDDVAVGAPNETAAASRAAEVFNFSPETYLATPHEAVRRGSTRAKYNYITSSPPVL